MLSNVCNSVVILRIYCRRKYETILEEEKGFETHEIRIADTDVCRKNLSFGTKQVIEVFRVIHNYAILVG